MKAGDKYIIEIGEVLTKKDSKEIGIVKGFKGFTIDSYGVSLLVPTKGTYSQGYEVGFQEGKAVQKVLPLTDKECVEHLIKSGWLEKHDKSVREPNYREGFKDGWKDRERLANEEYEKEHNKYLDNCKVIP